ncbi:hypothetical protein EIP86_007349 [Pleurotus ostreatoroseus]|nr:hypothetical protein EIP86_007349 [Pleurotus ostreatoroseus]
MSVPISTILATPSHKTPKLWPLRRSGAFLLNGDLILELLAIHGDDKYLLWINSPNMACPHIVTVLKEGHTPVDHIRAWVHAAELAHYATGRAQTNVKDVLSAIHETRTTVENHFSHFMDLIKQDGWALDGAGGGLLTGSSRAIRVEGDRKTR